MARTFSTAVLVLCVGSSRGCVTAVTNRMTARPWWCRVLVPLYKHGLVYFDVPILPTDHVSIPPLEVRLGLQCLDQQRWPGLDRA